MPILQMAKLNVMSYLTCISPAYTWQSLQSNPGGAHLAISPSPPSLGEHFPESLTVLFSSAWL